MSKKTNALRLLDAQKVQYEIVKYRYDAGDLSVEKTAEENGLQLERIFKTLVAKGDKNGVAIAVVPGHKNLDLKALARASGNKKMALAPVKDIQGLTGYIRGGCSPMGMKKEYPVFLDVSALSYSLIYVNAGHRGMLVGLPPEALKEATKAEVTDIAE